nr:MAG TPA: hypothetical protein [Caudoviricetes sp.]
MFKNISLLLYRRHYSLSLLYHYNKIVLIFYLNFPAVKWI